MMTHFSFHGSLRRIALAGFVMALVWAAGAQETRADCASPAGVAGAMVYNTDYNVMQFCNGTNWYNMAGGAAGVADGDKGDVTVSGTGSSWLIDDDVLDFTEFKDALALDASTDIGVTGSMVLSVTNSGTGDSFVVNDQASDTTPFVIDAAGNVAIGAATVAAGAALDVVGTATANQIILKSVSGAGAPGAGFGSSFTQAEVILATCSGFGSTNTNVARFSTVVVNTPGGALTYADSATLGARVTIGVTGIYYVSLIGQSVWNSGAGNSIAVLKNSTTSPSITSANTLFLYYHYDNQSSSNVGTSATVYLAAGDVLYPHMTYCVAGTRFEVRRID